MSYPYMDLIEKALAEDIGIKDITTNALIPESQQGHACITAKENGVVAGVEIAKQTFLTVDPALLIEIVITDGMMVKPGDIIAKLSGNTHGILTAERVALNFLQHLSGIATITSHYVKAVEGLKATIVDTRKTLPGLRELQKEAVRHGGGKNHRMRLDDGILIKDNHIKALRNSGKNIGDIVSLARVNAPSDISIEIEVTTIEEAEEAMAAGADIIMLDNMSLEEMKQAVKLINGKIKTEASGGVTLENVRTIAETGVDIISVGALTHSVMALDINLKLL